MFYIYVDDRCVYSNANKWETNRHFRETYIERYVNGGHKVRFHDSASKQEEIWFARHELPYREIQVNENWGLRPSDEGYRVD